MKIWVVINEERYGRPKKAYASEKEAEDSIDYDYRSDYVIHEVDIVNPSKFLARLLKDMINEEDDESDKEE